MLGDTVLLAALHSAPTKSVQPALGQLACIATRHAQTCSFHGPAHKR